MPCIHLILSYANLLSISLFIHTKLYSYIVVNNLWLALECYPYMVAGLWNFLLFPQSFTISQLFLTYFLNISQLFLGYFPFLIYFSFVSYFSLFPTYFPLISQPFPTYFSVISHLFPTYFSVISQPFLTYFSIVLCLLARLLACYIGWSWQWI